MEKKFEEYMLELKEKYGQVINHAFRKNVKENMKLGIEYYDLMYEIRDIFYAMMKAKCHIQIANVPAIDFIHDFSSATTLGRASVYWINRDEYERFGEIKGKEDDITIVYNTLYDIDKVLECIKVLLDTNTFPYYYAWQRKMYLKFEWNEEKTTYEPTYIVKGKDWESVQYIVENNVFPTLKSEIPLDMKKEK